MHPFVGTKGCPRRVGVLTKLSKKLASPEVIADFFTNAPPAGVQIRITKRLAPPEVPTNFFMNAPPGRGAYLNLVKGLPHRR